MSQFTDIVDAAEFWWMCVGGVSDAIIENEEVRELEKILSFFFFHLILVRTSCYNGDTLSSTFISLFFRLAHIYKKNFDYR